MKKSLLLLPLAALLLMLTACPRCPDPVEIDNGPLPDTALIYVPYHNGEIIRFRHSRNMAVNFSVLRGTYPQDYSACGECCNLHLRYESNLTTLTPDYPLFKIHLEISNLDTASIWFAAMVGGTAFRLPTTPEEGEEIRVDSALVDSLWYHNVFLLKGQWGEPGEEGIFVDSIWYNYTNGILKIIMSNGEYYELSKD